MGILPNIKAVAFLILLSYTVDSQLQLGQDLTRTPGASGTDVTTVAARLVEESGIFPPSNGLLRRIAWVESKDGTDPNAYGFNTYHGGIWQVDFIGFQATQNQPGLLDRYNDIQRVFGINWAAVTWMDLRQPLYSALAARLFLYNIMEAIPAAANVAVQGRYWSQNYPGAGTEQQFIDAVNMIPDECQVEGIDLAFMMDGSGSIGNSDFQVAKAFVRNVVSGFIIGPDNTRVAVIQYSSSPVVEFNLNAHTNNADLENAITAISYRGGGTSTGRAITHMRNNIFGGNGGARPSSQNIPRVGIVITDGRSGDDVLAPSNAARADSITMFAIGVGGFDINELNEIGNDPDSMFVFSADNFDAITNIRNLVRTATCEVSVELPPNETIRGVLNPNMVRYVSVPIPPSRIMTFTLETPTGPGATSYLSTRIRNPSRAFYEWKLETNPTKTKDQVFIDFNQTGRRKKRQAVTPGPTMVYVTIENDITASPGILPMATDFNFVGEEGNNIIPNTEFPCGPNTPCNNGGTCLQNIGGPYFCLCLPCFSGQQCEIDNSGCVNSACQNGGQCTPLADSCNQFYCMCPPCLYGQFCENRVDACFNHKCQNGAMCVSPQGTCRDYQCTCAGCFSGRLCDTLMPNPCSQSPCRNGGLCSPSGNCHSYQCSCVNGYVGANCEIAPETNLNFCNNFPCQMGGTCVSGHMPSGAYICVCRSGWAGRDCTTPLPNGIGPCVSSPCLNGASCYDSKASNSQGAGILEFTCVCAQGFTGPNCAQPVGIAQSLDECRLSSFSCQNNGVCNNAYFSINQRTMPFCSCPGGFIGLWCEIPYYDPCISNPCLNSGSCTAFNTYFICQCRAGFQGTTCAQGASNACISSPCVNGVCLQSDGSGFTTSYWCVCNTGWDGTNCDTRALTGPVPGEPDVTPPTINNCPGNMNQVAAAGQANARVTWNVPTPADPSDVSSSTNLFPGITSFIAEIGAATKLEYTFTDSSGNTAVCAFTISASSPRGPFVTGCPNNMQIEVNAVQTNILAAWSEPTSFPAAPVTQTHNPGDQFQRGSTLVTYTFGSGIDLSVCAFLVQVRDVIEICATRNPCRNNGQCLGTGTNYQCVCFAGFTGRYCEISPFCNPNPCLNSGTCTSTSNGFGCTCAPGFTGTNCHQIIDFNECISNPCLNGGLCIDGTNRYTCSCVGGFTGNRCETSSACNPNPCFNGGTCSPTPSTSTGFTCTCPPGFFIGPNCQTSINVDNECDSNPCQNGGICIDGTNGYTCSCSGEFTGIYCEMRNNNECIFNPCQNGGACIDETNGYTCRCGGGFTGVRCEISTVDGCNPNPCINGGTCYSSSTGPICTCPPGFYIGPNCRTSADAQSCNPNPCLNGGICSATSNGVTCACLADFTGTYCQTSTAVQLCNTNPCLNGGTCSATSNGFTCTCAPGFTGNNCQTSTGINECSSNPCRNGGFCVDGNNAYTCRCIAGYAGVNCEINVNECASSPCLNGGFCGDGTNGYTCSCVGGFTGIRCQISTQQFCNPNPCINGGICSSTSNGFSCACSSGFTGTNCQVFQAQQFCNHNPCINGGICSSTSNGFSCACSSGFTGTNCQVFPAQQFCNPNPCFNGGICSSTSNGFSCACSSGFTGTNCQLFPAQQFCNPNPCFNGGICSSTSNGFSCACSSGFSGTNCQVFQDPCSSFPCMNNGQCNGFANFYTCTCQSGFTGNNCNFLINQPFNGNPCLSNPCINGGFCNRFTNSYSCNCQSGFTGMNCQFNPQTTANPCSSFPCINGGLCNGFTNVVPNYYTCTCQSGFTGTNCENTGTAFGRKKKDTYSYDEICDVNLCSDVPNATCIPCVNRISEIYGYVCLPDYKTTQDIQCQDLYLPDEYLPESSNRQDDHDNKVDSPHKTQTAVVIITTLICALVFILIFAAIIVVRVVRHHDNSRKIKTRMTEDTAEVAGNKMATIS